MPMLYHIIRKTIEDGILMEIIEIFPVKTDDDIEVAQELFTECDDFLQEQLHEYDSFLWMAKHWQNCKEEVKRLPGKYSKPRGCIFNAFSSLKPRSTGSLLDAHHHSQGEVH